MVQGHQRAVDMGEQQPSGDRTSGHVPDGIAGVQDDLDLWRRFIIKRQPRGSVTDTATGANDPLGEKRPSQITKDSVAGGKASGGEGSGGTTGLRSSWMPRGAKVAAAGTTFGATEVMGR